MPRQAGALVHYASWADNTYDLYLAFDNAARAHAEQVHSEHAIARAAADAAAAQRDQTWTAFTETQRHYNQQLAHYGSLAHTDDPACSAALDRDISNTLEQLDAVRATIRKLMSEPALRTQPADRLTAERHAWQQQGDSHQLELAARTAARCIPGCAGHRSPANRQRPVLRRAPQAGSGIGR
jgi:hypothetical protein